MILRTDADRRDFIIKLLRVDIDKKPWRCTAEPYKVNRSSAQNRLSHMWYGEISKQWAGHTSKQVKNYCKFTYGAEIKSQSDSHFGEWFEKLQSTYDYEECVASMEFVNVTSELNVTQMVEYLNHIELFAQESGFELTHPADIYDEAYGRTQ